MENYSSLNIYRGCEVTSANISCLTRKYLACEQAFGWAGN